MKSLPAVCVLGLSVFAGVPASEALPILTYQAVVDGSQRVPPTGSLATGFAIVTVDIGADLLTLDLTWTGLAAEAMGGHIHCCAGSGANGPNAINFPAFPALTSGAYLQTVDLTQLSLYNPVFVMLHGGTAAQAKTDLLAALAAGTAYVDINNTAFPPGEIRGQLAEVPEPATMILLGTGLAGLALRRQRQR